MSNIHLAICTNLDKQYENMLFTTDEARKTYLKIDPPQDEYIAFHTLREQQLYCRNRSGSRVKYRPISAYDVPIEIAEGLREVARTLDRKRTPFIPVIRLSGKEIIP